ncbi:hypothetical protein [Methyloversatilis sp.]|uniref:hypothetical protein n=1 Tax=Methyloversatilis sp. TaxID=2569862 RepID=UPI0027B8A5A9|nr:hypothetical protein [Methyloversatilis sp.]
MAAENIRTTTIDEQELIDIRDAQAQAAIQAAVLIQAAKAQVDAAISAGTQDVLPLVAQILDMAFDKAEEAIA